MELVSEGPGHRFAGVANVLVSVYWAPPTAAALRERIPWIEEASARYGRIGLFVVVTEQIAGGLPGGGFRDESRAQAERFRAQLEFSASVIEGRAVRNTLARAFLRGLSVVAGRDIEVRFFDAVPDGAAWAAGRAAAHGGPGAEALVAAVNALRPPAP